MSALDAIRPSCDLCKRMKIKCDKAIGGCSQCVARKSECIVSRFQRKKETNHRRFRAISTGAQVQGEAAVSDANHEAHHRPQDVVTLANKANDAFYCFGPSSGYSLFTPNGIEWITRMTGRNSLESLMADETFCRKTIWGSFDAHVFRNLPADDHEPLPSHDEMHACVDSYLDSFNRTFTLFERTEVMELLRPGNIPHPEEDSASYAALNIILATGSLLLRLSEHTGRKANLMVDPTDKAFYKSWRYFRNACSTFSDITFQDTNLVGVSALVAMAFMMTLTENVQPSYILISAAGRLAQSMGLHQRLGQNLVPPLQAERQQHIFWAIYILEKGISFRSGRPSMLNDDDIAICFPHTQIKGVETAPKSAEQITFRSLAQLAFFESRIYQDVYSDKARLLPEPQRQSRINSLDNELRKWKQLLPAAVRPGQTIPAPSHHAMNAMRIYILHLAYYHCLVILHHSPTLIEPLGCGENPMLDRSPEQASMDYYRSHSMFVCLAAARAMLRLLKSIVSQRDHLNGLLWNATSQPLPAFLVIFTQLLKHPLEKTVAADLELMETVLVHLGGSTSNSHPDSSIQTLVAFKELYRIAKDYVCKAVGSSESTLTEDYVQLDETEADVNTRQRSEIWYQVDDSSFHQDFMFDDYYFDPILPTRGNSDLHGFASWPFSILDIDSSDAQLNNSSDHLLDNSSTVQLDTPLVTTNNSFSSALLVDDPQTSGAGVQAAGSAMASTQVVREDSFLPSLSSHGFEGCADLPGWPETNWEDDWNL